MFEYCKGKGYIMYKIGKAKLLLDEYKSFIGSEIEHGRKKEKSLPL